MSRPTNSVRCLWVLESSALNTVTLIKEIHSKQCFKFWRNWDLNTKFCLIVLKWYYFHYHKIGKTFAKTSISAFSWMASSLQTPTVME